MEGIIEWIKKTYAADRPEYYPPTETSGYREDDNNNSETPTPTSSPTPTEAESSPTPIL